MLSGLSCRSAWSVAAAPFSLAALAAVLLTACDGSATMTPIAGTMPPAGPPPLTQGRWEPLPDMPGPTRTYPGVAAVGSQLFVVAGFSRKIGTTTTNIYDTVTAFDTHAGTWSTLDPLPKPVMGPNVAGVNGKLYVLGGFGTTDAYAYDVAHRTWAAVAPVPVTLGHGVAAIGLSGTKILLAGGAQPGQSANNLNTGMRVRNVLSYDTASDRWENLPDLALARGYAMGAVVANTFWVIGGSSDFARTDEVVGLDLTTRQWTDGPPPPLTLSSAGATALDGRIYVMGGVATSSGAIGPLTLVFDPAQPRDQAWGMAAPLNTPRFATGAAAIDGRIYFPGGVALVRPPDMFDSVPTLEVFIP
jgi:N-acetylneuraminic acid mutarotase